MCNNCHLTSERVSIWELTFWFWFIPLKWFSAFHIWFHSSGHALIIQQLTTWEVRPSIWDNQAWANLVKCELHLMEMETIFRREKMSLADFFHDYFFVPRWMQSVNDFFMLYYSLTLLSHSSGGTFLAVVILLFMDLADFFVLLEIISSLDTGGCTILTKRIMTTRVPE